MVIQLKKGRDGPATLACVRSDGTRTWGKEHPFFPVHDITHCVVESVLGFDQAFFGLIATGWEIDDFAKPGASRRLPFQAIVAEHVVGIFDRERALVEPMTPDEFNESVVASLPPAQRDAFTPLSAEQLAQVRASRQALAARWHALAPGATMEVPFPLTRRDTMAFPPIKKEPGPVKLPEPPKPRPPEPWEPARIPRDPVPPKPPGR
jgi:hypothetical protein